MPPIRALQRTAGLLASYELGRQCLETKGSTSFSLPRRLSVCPSGSRNSREPGSISGGTATESRVGCKSAKVYPKTNQTDRVPRNRLGHSNQSKTATTGESSQHVASTSEINRKPFVGLEVRNIFDRKIRIRFERNPDGATLHSKPTESRSDPKKRDTSQKVSSSSSGDCRLSLVVSTPSPSGKNICSRLNNLLDNRRFRHRLGLSARKPHVVRNLDERAKTLAYKQERTFYGIHRPVQISNNREMSIDYAPIGQQDSCFLHSQSGGDPIVGSARGNSGSVRAGKSPGSHDCSLFHTRSVQHCSRSSFQGNEPAGLASQRSCNPTDFRKVGNPSDRSICLLPVQGSPKICDNRCKGYGGGVCECVQPGVALQVGVDLPSPSFDPKGYSASGQSVRCFSDGGASLGEGVLERDTETQGSRCSDSSGELGSALNRPLIQPPSGESSRSLFRGLEDTGWSPLVAGLGTGDVNLLQSAWRNSTWKTYGSAWRQWVSWAKENGINPSRPRPLDVVSYLGYLTRVKNLAYATILVHKSVVVSIADPANESHLSSHPLITTMLKGISLSKCSSSVGRKKIWNVKDLIGWMRSNIPLTDNIFQVSRHVSLLLLLASGRRIHDLTLLRIDEQHCQILDTPIVFWPVFGSKTDSPRFQQSGWELISSGDDCLDLVRWVRCLIECSSVRRNGRAELNNLFITTRGEVKAASRTVISGWIKTALQGAGIDCSPGSIRSAVASNSFENEVPLDKILAKGNWRSSNVFFKHYCKQVERRCTPDNDSLINTFNVI
ncbi:hypothetical protein O0L34_g2144 [Tuta absoluta]|nr:hypothetical protein O0L34_g2144 [Tuta absoluta]